MATRTWLGGAVTTPQVDSVTPANVNIGNTFTVTVNNKNVSFVATAGTVANVTAGLSAAIEASEEPEFNELSAVDNTTNVLVTGPSDGTPFTLTATATGGTATNTRAAVTAASSPYHWSVATNWTGATVPITGDTAIFDSISTVDCLHGLDQSAVTLAVLTITDGYTGAIGLPERNTSAYDEYRETYLKVGATILNIGGVEGSGSGRIKINLGTVQTTAAVLSSSGPDGTEAAAVLLLGTHAANVLSVQSGSVGIATLAASVSTIATLNVGNGASTVTGGSGLTLTTLNQSAGTVSLNAGLTTATLTGDGTLTVFAGNITTANIDGGVFYYHGTGTITTLNVSNGGTADFTRDPRARTVTDCTLQSGARLVNTFRKAAFSNAAVLNRCSLKDVDVDFGTHLSLTVAAGP